MRLVLVAAALVVVATMAAVYPSTTPQQGLDWSQSPRGSLGSTASLDQKARVAYNLRAEQFKQKVLTSVWACHRSTTLKALLLRIKEYEGEYSRANRIGFVLYHREDNTFGITPFGDGAELLQKAESPNVASVDRFISKLYRANDVDGIAFIRYLLDKVPTWFSEAKPCPGKYLSFK
ncbi:hypothetical protein H4R34_003441 [Dimargaris verticillata]|uniref:Uncharacterized protein n=1 Tax=Dimargaris verticillata TaxID=2761393 RepID=A0A9W8E921_9FUNG|nr:hypothetical protein H4R34_003441 [Dimargaris verticillata]